MDVLKTWYYWMSWKRWKRLILLDVLKTSWLGKDNIEEEKKQVILTEENKNKLEAITSV